MNEVKNTKMYNTVIEIYALTYTLKVALDNYNQPINGTSPYGEIARIIEHKIASILEMINPED